MRYAVWGRAAASTREWLLATFWTAEEAEQFRSEAVVAKVPLRGGTGDQVCEAAVVDDYDGHTAIGDGRPFKRPAKYRPRYLRLVTELGPNGVKRLVRPAAGTSAATGGAKGKESAKSA